MSLLLLALLPPPSEPAGGTGAAPFSVLSVSPESDAHDAVEIDPVTITFSGPVKATTCDSTSIYLHDGTANVSAAVACSESTATVTPTTFLTHKQAFTVHVTTGVHSADDVALGAPFTSTFTTRNVLFMFATSSHNGDLGGRTGADALCGSAYSGVSSLGCNTSTIRAFVTVGGDDEIRDMHLKYGVLNDVPVRGPNGELIDQDFPSLLDGGILRNLNTAGLGMGLFWTGADNDGGTAPLNGHCSGWTISSGFPNGGALGSDNKTNGYLADSAWNCSESAPILCLCSRPE